MHEDPRYCTNANNDDCYWHFSGKLHIRLPLSPKCGAVPSISRDPAFGIRLLKQGEPSPCHVIEWGAWPLFPLKNQRVGNNRRPSICYERTAASRTQPQLNKPALGDSVPMASSLPTATLAASSEVWRRPPSCRGGTGASGSGTKAFTGSPPMRSSPSLPTWLPCNEDPPYCTNANNGERYWHFGGKLHIGLPSRRSMGLFPAFRATHGSESGRLGWGNQAPVT